MAYARCRGAQGERGRVLTAGVCVSGGCDPSEWCGRAARYARMGQLHLLCMWKIIECFSANSERLGGELGMTRGVAYRGPEPGAARPPALPDPRRRLEPERSMEADQFLGFEFPFCWEADSHGEPRVWRRTAREKLRTSIKACKEWPKAHRHYSLPMLIPAMIRKVRGHYNYFRAIGNMTSLWIFYREGVKLLYKWLNRQSQRRNLTWEGIKRVLKSYAFPASNQTRRAV